MGILVRVIMLAPSAVSGCVASHLGKYEVISTPTVAQFVRNLHPGGVRWAIINPDDLVERAYEEAIASVEYAGCRTVFLTALDRVGHERFCRAHRLIVPELVVRETSNDCAGLISVLRLNELSICSQILLTLTPLAQRLSTDLRRPTMSLFGWVKIPESVEAFCQRSRRTTGAARAQFSDAGLAPPNHVLAIARVSRAFADLANTDVPLDTLALKHGFGCVRTLERTMDKFLGTSPRKAARLLESSEASRKLSTALTSDEFVARVSGETVAS